MVLYSGEDGSWMCMWAENNRSNKQRNGLFQKRMRTAFLVLLTLVMMASVAMAVPPTGVQLNQTRLTINRGAHAVLEAQVTPPEGDAQTLVWNSGSPNIVRVTPEASGKKARIDGLVAGTAVVQVLLSDGTVAATCQVTVRVPVERVSVSQETVTLIRGQETELTAVVHPGDASNKRIRWSTDQEDVVEFVDGGVAAFGNHGTVRVRGVAAGSTTVNVETEDGRKRKSVAVQVIVPLESIGFKSKVLTIDVDETAFVETVLNPLDTTSTGLLYETTDASVVKVDEAGLIRAVGEGTARVIVRSQENELISDYLQVTVQAGSGQAQGASQGETTPPENEDPEEGQAQGEEEETTPELAPSTENALPEETTPGRGLGVWLLAGAVLLVLILFGARLLMKKPKRQRRSKNTPIPVKKSQHTPVAPVLPGSEEEAPNLTRRMAPLPVIESGERVMVAALSGEFEGQVIELAEDTLVIGRDPLFSHLVYPSDFEVISRKHVVIEHDRESGRCYLRDMSSSGTYRAENNEKLVYDQPVAFNDGQQFYLAVPGELYEIRFADSHEGQSGS